MSQPQSGVLPEATKAAIFLTCLVAATEDGGARVRKACAGLPAVTGQLAALDPKAALASVVGFGAGVWDRLFAAAQPRQLRPFRALEGLGGTAPATPGDLFVHIRSERHDLNFELAQRLMAEFGDDVSLVEEVHGFRYMERRDLTGFVDGTENPAGAQRAVVALAGAEDPAFSNGSYIAVQRYIHDLAAWQRLPVAAQERIIARTKADDVEFEPDAKPLTAHIKRVAIREGGKSLEILRHSMPYGTTAEKGLLFVAYGATPDTFDRMLDSMFLGDGEGHYDHLMNYARAVTGCAFFAPARDWLEAQAD